jgi:hypothetical protein
MEVHCVPIYSGNPSVGQSAGTAFLSERCVDADYTTLPTTPTQKRTHAEPEVGADEADNKTSSSPSPSSFVYASELATRLVDHARSVLVYHVPAHITLREWHAFLVRELEEFVSLISHTQVVSFARGGDAGAGQECYGLLVQFATVDATLTFRRAAHGKQFNSIEPDELCVAHMMCAVFCSPSPPPSTSSTSSSTSTTSSSVDASASVSIGAGGDSSAVARVFPELDLRVQSAEHLALHTHYAAQLGSGGGETLSLSLTHTHTQTHTDVKGAEQRLSVCVEQCISQQEDSCSVCLDVLVSETTQLGTMHTCE